MRVISRFGAGLLVAALAAGCGAVALWVYAITAGLDCIDFSFL